MSFDTSSHQFIERHSIFVALNADNIVHEWELIVNGIRTDWTMYELSPASRYYPKGPFGFVLGNSEPQFPTFEEAKNALSIAWESANGDPDPKTTAALAAFANPRDTISADDARTIMSFIATWEASVFQSDEPQRLAVSAAHSALMNVCPHPSYSHGGLMGNVCDICGGMEDV